MQLTQINQNVKNEKDFSQNNPWHIYDVWNHTKTVLKNSKPDKEIRLALLLHDIGKPFCKNFLEEEGRAQYLNHANVGSYEAMFYAKCAKFNEKEAYDLINLIQFQMRADDCAGNEQATNKLKLLIE